MRTLKKTLSLVLVVAMVLGLCVVGASAYNKVEDFTDDVDKIGDAYYEAVGVLTGIGIIDGMTETAFEPQGNYTREQAAKIIAYMQLGKEKADSLKCTVAPFEDVAASRWSAGYIAYCVEQGIIDGMTETTFEPTGKLTGFQWAKMLLCAVGFGVKGEFTGSSWSVNTAKVAHTVDLFKGDLAGADHTAITREQAALYAFNVLTDVEKVAYSPNVTSYVYGIRGYETVNGIGSTLATDVYNLYSATGIIVDSESVGASTTKLANSYNGTPTIAIKANTDIDEMYHAARIWYIEGTKANTGVFTTDLAVATTYECYDMDVLGAKAVAAAEKKDDVAKTLTIGSGTAYEAYLIDNTAIDAGYAYVTLYANVGARGYDNTVANTLSINGTTVSKAAIKTDVSKIAYNDTIIYYQASSKYESGKSGWYVYPVSYTEGIVSSVKKTDGIVSVVLSDGTVIEKSKLNSVAYDPDYFVIGNKYGFMLDTHGDFMSAYKNGVRNLWAFTGDFKVTTEFNGWVSEQVVVAQFVNVDTNEEQSFPVVVLNSVGGTSISTSNLKKTDRGNYYDISASTTVGGLYVATLVEENDGLYAGKYMVDDATTIGRYTKSTTVDGTTVNYDPSTVVFKILSGTGSNVQVKTYTGVTELLAAYKAATTGSVTLENCVWTVTTNITKATIGTTLFAFEDNLLMTSDYVFVPYDVGVGDWTSVTGDGLSYRVEYEGAAYIDGEELTVFNIYKKLITTGYELERGFYTYTLKNGVMTLTGKAENNGSNNCYYGKPALNKDATSWTMTIAGNTYPVAASPIIKDLRVSAYTPIATLDELYLGMQKDADNNLTVAVTINPVTKTVECIYVVDTSWQSTVTIGFNAESVAAGWYVVGTPQYDTLNNKITVTVGNSNLSLVTGTTYSFTAAGTPGSATTNSLAAANGVAKVEITPDGWSIAERDVVVTLVAPSVNASATNGVTDYSVSSAPATVMVGKPITVTLTHPGTFSKDGTIVATFVNGSDTVAVEAAVKAGDKTASMNIYPQLAGNYVLSSVAYKA